MSTKATMFKILNGPNRQDFVNAFSYAYDGEIGKSLCQLKIESEENGNRTQVNVRLCEIQHVVTISGKTKMSITELQHEDGSGHSFNFKGWYSAPNLDKAVPCEGYYNADNRTGWLRTTLN